jgi:hypothetical protein
MVAGEDEFERQFSGPQPFESFVPIAAVLLTIIVD